MLSAVRDSRTPQALVYAWQAIPNARHAHVLPHVHAHDRVETARHPHVPAHHVLVLKYFVEYIPQTFPER